MNKWAKYINDYDFDLWQDFHLNSGLTKPFQPVKTKKFTRKPGYQNLGITKLLPEKIINTPTLEQAFKARKSNYSVSNKILDLKLLSNLLTLAYSPRVSGKQKRTSPSAGGIYPIDLYIYVNQLCTKTTTLQKGLYFYDCQNSGVRYLNNIFDEEAYNNSFLQSELLQKSMLQLFIVAHFPEIIRRYGRRGYRFAFLEAGHIAQNINLACVALDVNCINIGGFYDSSLNQLIDLDGIDNAVIYCQMIM